MRICGIDPGPEMSALVVFDGDALLRHERLANPEVLVRLQGGEYLADALVIEQIASMGMAVGADVFETCVWSGRFIQAWSAIDGLRRWDRVKRHEVKTALCGSQRAKDPNIRQALIDQARRVVGPRDGDAPERVTRSGIWTLRKIGGGY